jgi:glutamyl-tRNA reductase
MIEASELRGRDPDQEPDSVASELALRLEMARRLEVARTLRRLNHLDESDKAHIEALSHQIVSAIMTGPLDRLACEGEHAEIARFLFGLEDQGEGCAGPLA